MAGKGAAGGSQWSQQQQQQHQNQQHQQHQQPAPPVASSHLLSPNSGASAAAGNRRRSTLSNHGFFIEYSNRRNSCLNQHRQPALAHLGLVSPVRGQPCEHGPSETGQSPVRLAGRQSQASCSTRTGQPLSGPYARTQSLMPPISAPSALVGSRKTSIFDPAGHSLASTQLLSVSAAASCDVTRRRSTMTMGPAALAAQQQMLAVAKNHSAAGVHAGKRSQTLVQQVPVIGCSPSSIEGSLKALDESRRYEKMLRTLREHQKQKERRRRKRRRRLHNAALPRSTSQQHQHQEEPAGRHSLRRAIRNAARGLLGARPSNQAHPNPSRRPLHEQVRLSVSTLSLGSWSTSDGSENSSPVTSDSQPSSLASSMASLPPNTERQAQQKSLVSQAFRKLASLSASSPSVGIRHTTRSAPSNPTNQNYWHYYYYLKENSIDQSCVGADEPLLAGAPLSPKKRRERLNANFSLARLEILNCGATCRPDPGQLLEAQELAAQGKPEQLARMFSQSTDFSLALSTSSSSSSNSSTTSSLNLSSSSHGPRDTDEPELESSSTENWSVSSVQLESIATTTRMSTSAESSATTVGPGRAPLAGAKSAPNSDRTPMAETVFSAKQQQPAATGKHSSTPKARKEVVHRSAPQQADDDEDDFERLNRCHRGYKLKAAELLEMMQQQEPAKQSRRNSSQRLSVRSVRSIGSPGGPQRDTLTAKGRLAASSSTNLTNAHGISLSWGTLNQVQTATPNPARHLHSQPADAKPAPPATLKPLGTGTQVSPGRQAGARRCTSASLGRRGSRRHRLIEQAKLARLNISANDLAVGSTGPPNRHTLPTAPGFEPRARAHSTGSKWNQPEASKSTPARLPGGSSWLLARSSVELPLSGGAPPVASSRGPDPKLASQQSAACAPPPPPPPPDDEKTRRPSAPDTTNRERASMDDERLQLFELVRKGSFTCMLVGSRQTGKRSIVKCFVKLLNEFKLAVVEYRKEKMLTQLLGCSQQLQGILQQHHNNNNNNNHHQDDSQPRNGLMRSRVNSWFAGGPVNRLLTSHAGRQARNSTCLGDRGLGRQSSATSGLGDADSHLTNSNNNKTLDNRFLCVASGQGMNKSDTSIDYQSTAHDNENFSLSFRVPTTTLHTRSLGPVESASMRERTRKRRARSKLRKLLSLRELNKKRVRIRFSSRPRLAARLVKSSGARLLDAYLVVYAINDRDSFTEAARLLRELTTLRRAHNRARYVPVILVANKVDLERAKVVKNEDGRALARKHNCKFMEISCAVGYNLDNLLVGIRTQLVLKHHVELNSYLSSVDRRPSNSRRPPDTDTGAASKTASAHSRSCTDTNRKQNIIMRFYKRYVMDNFQGDNNYECDNFSVL